MSKTQVKFLEGQKESFFSCVNNPEKQCILAVDDSPDNLILLKNLLEDRYKIKVAISGDKALQIAQKSPQPDMILLDVMMPDMDGYEVCKRLKANSTTKNIPVIFVTGKTEASDELKGFELGGLDYITKPFNPSIIKARVQNHLELMNEKRKTELLLGNILPQKVIDDLKLNGTSTPEFFDNVSIMFIDLVGFTPAAAKMAPENLIAELTDMFTALDGIVEENGAERIKTIGDAYLAVCGMPEPNTNHATIMVRVAEQFIAFLKGYNIQKNTNWKIRAGINSGGVVGGIVGRTKYLYDIFGDAVNTAARVQGKATPMGIMVSESTWEKSKSSFTFNDEGLVELKGKGGVRLYSIK